MPKRTIPELREALNRLADELEAEYSLTAAEELRQMVRELVRASPARKRAPQKHRPLTEREKEAIRKLAFSSKGRKMHLDEIAARFNTNPGRVSEAVHGR